VYEPISEIYHDPVVVCDFTALYPSLIIAYNLDYATICGKVMPKTVSNPEDGQTTGRIGMQIYDESTTAKVVEDLIPSLGGAGGGREGEEDKAYIIPSGSIFIGEDEKKGVLPQVRQRGRASDEGVAKDATSLCSCGRATNELRRHPQLLRTCDLALPPASATELYNAPSR
jgi:DNA polymerase elongation subunit (family B)